jgi:uncharacterized protein (DUF362 family)/Pyruvate/2-oxoacid:ferredoxin oxidoreductase delta subunit
MPDYGTSTSSPPITAVAAVACPDYNPERLDAAVSDAITASGGLPPSITPGSSVLIKPNLLTAKPPEQAVTTHPDLVAALVRFLRRNGIDRIVVGDSPAGLYSWEELWEKTGYTEMARREKIRLVPFEEIHRVDFPGAGILPITKVWNDVDAVISVPKLKTHTLTKMTAAVKNSYGLIVGGAKSGLHGRYPSPRQMGEFVGRLHHLLKPDYVLMDSIVCMEGDGPSDGTPARVGVLLAGTDAVAADSMACRVYGYAPEDLPYLAIAAKEGPGIADRTRITATGNGWDIVNSIRLKRSRSDFLHRFPGWLFGLGTRFLLCKPEICPTACVRCGKCAAVCPGNAIEKHSDSTYRIDPKRCVLCVCCMEACPCHAVSMISPGVRIHASLKRFFS